MKYAVEVAKVGSINKASEILIIAQPSLSRAIKELESDLGITIFDRSAKGMFLTPEGEEFIGYAKKILNQIDEVETMYKVGLPQMQRFSISVPRASYIADAFVNFSKKLSSDPAEIYYKETNCSRTLKNVISSDFKLGIIRYAENYDMYFNSMLEEKNLKSMLISKFRYLLIMSKDHPLAKVDNISFGDLTPYIEVAHTDPFVPSLPLSEVKKTELSENVDRRICVFERASEFEILSHNKETFMWVSPMPQSLLDRYGLVQRDCKENKKVYKDILIHRKDYTLTELDKLFFEELKNSKKNILD
jgi:DNA-binding transcriptional LysR family regulator